MRLSVCFVLLTFVASAMAGYLWSVQVPTSKTVRIGACFRFAFLSSKAEPKNNCMPTVFRSLPPAKSIGLLGGYFVCILLLNPPWLGHYVHHIDTLPHLRYPLVCAWLADASKPSVTQIRIDLVEGVSLNLITTISNKTDLAILYYDWNVSTTIKTNTDYLIRIGTSNADFVYVFFLFYHFSRK